VDDNCNKAPLLEEARRLDLDIEPLYDVEEGAMSHQLMAAGKMPEAQFLLATESTARGLDIPHLSHVFILCTVEEVATDLNLCTILVSDADSLSLNSCLTFSAFF
jgi:hypothetical protein